MQADVNFLHQPVLLSEVVEALTIDADGIYIDCTFGRGGHSSAILKNLSAKGRVLAIDRDKDAITFAKKNLAAESRLMIEHANFSQIATIAEQYKLLGKINGILLDLGVSSPQIDDPTRGFSFMHDGPLDMRMNTNQGISAANWLQHVSIKELETVLKEYGQERYAKKIAASIVKQREVSAILTTKQLADVVQTAVGHSREKKHPATRTFQAIRIFINSELEELTNVLKNCFELLVHSGRLLVITFHSLEDQIVKDLIRQYSQSNLPRKLPVVDQFKPMLRKVCKPIKPTEQEIKFNPRARSAKLYVMERISC